MEDEKKMLRKAMRLRAASLSADDERRLSEDIWRQVELLPEFAQASCILIYMSIPGEVPTRAFIAKWASRKQFALPLVCGEHLELRLYDPVRLVEGYRGIIEPSADAQSVAPDEIEMAIVPGTAFSRQNGKVKRMGRGGGFYDRLLPQLSCPEIGVAFSFREVESIPSDPWDVDLDELIVDTSH